MVIRQHFPPQVFDALPMLQLLILNVILIIFGPKFTKFSSAKNVFCSEFVKFSHCKSFPPYSSWFFEVLKFCECLIFSFFTILFSLVVFLNSIWWYFHILRNSWNLSMYLNHTVFYAMVSNN